MPNKSLHPTAKALARRFCFTRIDCLEPFTIYEAAVELYVRQYNMKYDDASWHYGGEYPSDLPIEAAATHTGMFLAWCVVNDLAGEDLIDIADDDIDNLKQRSITPGAFFMECCDGKFTDEDVSDDIHSFVESYYDLEKGSYLSDYETTVGMGIPSLYHVPDTWQTYDVIAPMISRAYKERRV